MYVKICLLFLFVSWYRPLISRCYLEGTDRYLFVFHYIEMISLPFTNRLSSLLFLCCIPAPLSFYYSVLGPPVLTGRTFFLLVEAFISILYDPAVLRIKCILRTFSFFSWSGFTAQNICCTWDLQYRFPIAKKCHW